VAVPNCRISGKLAGDPGDGRYFERVVHPGRCRTGQSYAQNAARQSELSPNDGPDRVSARSQHVMAANRIGSRMFAARTQLVNKTNQFN